jgi:N-acetylglucosamine-6-sulfatase
MSQKPGVAFLLFFIFLLFHLPIATVGAQSEAPTAGTQPNIILIVMDDLDKRAIEFMPNLKRELIDQGMNFKNYFVDVPTCCPSRASLFRGQYAHNTKVFRNSGINGGFEAFRDLGLESSTIATWLKAAGYRTALFGKYLNGYPAGQEDYVPPGWDDWNARVQGLYLNYRLNENGRIVGYGRKQEDYETDIHSDKLTTFIRLNAGKVPFFAYVAPLAPHVPSIPAIRHQNMFAGAMAPRVPSFNEEDVSDKPRRFRNLKPLSNQEIAEIDRLYQARLECMIAVDEMIGRLFEALRNTSQLDNTFIFFTSDNGFHQGEHRIRIGKDTPYDEATNVPLVIRGPGITKKCFNTRFAQNIDLGPTFAELAGARIPAFVDGRSLVPAFTHDKDRLSDRKQEALIEHWPNSSSETPNFLALRTQSYLYVEYDTNEVELYDIEKDPYQTENISAEADPALLRKLSLRLKELSTAKGAGKKVSVVDR